LFYRSLVGELGSESFEYTTSQFRVGNLASTEAEVDSYLVALIKKLTCGLRLYFDIMCIGLQANADLLDVDLLLIASGFLQVFVLLVTILSPVDDANDGGSSLRSNFDQVEACVFSCLAGLC